MSINSINNNEIKSSDLINTNSDNNQKEIKEQNKTSSKYNNQNSVENVMKIAKEKNIVFNVCPTSNIILGYVDSIKKHPIKKMYEYGLKVTIATDDLLYFNSDINDEYLKLFNGKVLNAENLDNIRKNGIYYSKRS